MTENIYSDGSDTDWQDIAAAMRNLITKRIPECKDMEPETLLSFIECLEALEQFEMISHFRGRRAQEYLERLKSTHEKWLEE